MLTVYSAQWCSHCKELVNFLEKRSVDYKIVDLDLDEERFNLVMKKGHEIIPFVYKDNEFIGDFDATVSYVNETTE